MLFSEYTDGVVFADESRQKLESYMEVLKDRDCESDKNFVTSEQAHSKRGPKQANQKPGKRRKRKADGGEHVDSETTVACSVEGKENVEDSSRGQNSAKRRKRQETDNRFISETCGTVNSADSVDSSVFSVSSNSGKKICIPYID